MASNFRPEGRQNSGDNVFEGIPVGKEESGLFAAFLDGHDFSANSRRAFTQDVRKFAGWFNSANKEPFRLERITTRDITDFKDHLRREKGPSGSDGQPGAGDGAALARLADRPGPRRQQHRQEGEGTQADGSGSEGTRPQPGAAAVAGSGITAGHQVGSHLLGTALHRLSCFRSCKSRTD